MVAPAFSASSDLTGEPDLEREAGLVSGLRETWYRDRRLAWVGEEWGWEEEVGWVSSGDVG